MRTTRVVRTEGRRPRTPPRKKRIALPDVRSGWSRPTASLPAIVSTSILEASSLKRGFGPEGTKPLLTRHEKKRLLEMFEQGVDPTIAKMLEDGTSSTARGLLLRAIHARHGRLAESMSELEAFAGELSTVDCRLSTREMLRRATVLDLDSTTNSVAFDPAVLSERRGTTRAPIETNDSADNDGLFQRLTGSCGPTVVQMMICNADPISSFEAHRRGLNSDSSTDAVADFQRRLLEAGGGIAIGRREALLRARLHNGAGRLIAMGAIDRRDAAELRAFAEKGGPRTEGVERALTEMRARWGGPTQAELARLRRAGPIPDKDEGIGTEEFLALIKKHVAPLTGVDYTITSVFARGQCWRHLDRVEAALREGIDVPFGISEPGHWMLMTQVKGRVPNRSFLISDPEGGRTVWVKERDLRDGSCFDRQFHLCVNQQRGYVDCFVLPHA